MHLNNPKRNSHCMALNGNIIAWLFIRNSSFIHLRFIVSAHGNCSRIIILSESTFTCKTVLHSPHFWWVPNHKKNRIYFVHGSVLPKYGSELLLNLATQSASSTLLSFSFRVENSCIFKCLILHNFILYNFSL